MERIRRHAFTLGDKVSLLELKRENWQYFVEKMFTITEDPYFNIDDEAYLEKELITNVLENVEMYQKFCMNIYDICAESFKEYNLSSLSYILESIIKEMRLDWTYKENFE